MFDWLGLSAESTQLVGWIFIGVAVILMLFLVWFAVQIVKDMKKTQKKLEVMDTLVDNPKLNDEKITKEEIAKNKKLIKTEKKNKKYEEKSKKIAEKAKAKQKKLENKLNKKSISTDQILPAKEQTILEPNIALMPSPEVVLKQPEISAKTEVFVKEEQEVVTPKTETIINKEEEHEDVQTSVEKNDNKVEEKELMNHQIQQSEKTTAEIIEEIQEQMENNAYLNALKDIDENKKNYYCKVKNLFCTFPELDNELIKDAETFDYNKRVLGLITVRNGNLILYLKLSKADLDKRFAHDETEYNKYKRIPIQFVLTDEIAMRDAMVSIEKLVSELELFKSETYKSRKFNYLIKF